MPMSTKNIVMATGCGCYITVCVYFKARRLKLNCFVSFWGPHIYRYDDVIENNKQQKIHLTAHTSVNYLNRNYHNLRLTTSICSRM